MKRQLLLVLGMALQLAGWFSAFLLNSIPEYRTFYIIVPTLLLGTGMGVALKTVGGKLTALTLALTALTALLTLNQLFPSRGVSISAFQQHLHENGHQGRVVDISSPDPAQIDLSGAVEAFADIEISLFAQLPDAPAMMTMDDSLHLYVSLPDLGAVYRLEDVDRDGFAERMILFSADLDRPTGVAWLDGKLYVAEPAGIMTLTDPDRDGRADTSAVLLDSLPDDGGHWSRALSVFEQNLYLGIGSRCNACDESNPLRASVQKVNPVDAVMTGYATGLRQPLGLAWSPDGVLWSTDIGRTGQGGAYPDEINRIAEAGDYGWPYCYGKNDKDPLMGDSDRCQNTLESSFELPARSIPSGLAFGHRLNAPEEFRSSLYVALNGSNPETGARIIRIPYEKERIGARGKEFIRSLRPNEKKWGQPRSLYAGKDGNLYVSDSYGRSVFRIRWLVDNTQ